MPSSSGVSRWIERSRATRAGVLASRALQCGRIRICGHAAPGLDDGAVAGAAAQVSRQRMDDRVASGLRAGYIEREERHHEAGRAEAALRGMTVDHRLLHRMQRRAL